MGHAVRLIPPAYVKPDIKRGKNGAVDAAAVCEAVSRPGVRFVPVKSAAQQAALTLHKTRELLVKQRTMCVNALRAHLAEFGVVAAKGTGRAGDKASAAGYGGACQQARADHLSDADGRRGVPHGDVRNRVSR